MDNDGTATAVRLYKESLMIVFLVLQRGCVSLCGRVREWLKEMVLCWVIKCKIYPQRYKSHTYISIHPTHKMHVEHTRTLEAIEFIRIRNMGKTFP